MYNQRQFVTGNQHKPGGHLPESIYSQALDALVIGCTDVIPVYNGHILIGQRTWEPQSSWWCFGGRMRKGELFEAAAARNLKRELFSDADEIEIQLDRFVLVGVYNLLWDTRAQEPTENGCHMISVTMLLRLEDTEVASLHPNEEYSDIQWVLPNEILQNSNAYHPCLVQMAEDVAKLLFPCT